GGPGSGRLPAVLTRGPAQTVATSRTERADAPAAGQIGGGSDAPAPVPDEIDRQRQGIRGRSGLAADQDAGAPGLGHDKATGERRRPRAWAVAEQPFERRLQGAEAR